MSRRRSRGAAQVAVVVCVASALVAGSPSPGQLERGVLEAVSLEIRQSRADWADRLVQVRLSNDSPRGLTVRELRLDSQLFDGTAGSRTEQVVLAGTSREVSVALGRARCGGVGESGGAGRGPGDAGRSGATTVSIELADDGGRQGILVLAPPDPNGHLERIHAEDCAAAAVAAGARLALGAALRTSEVAGTLVAVVELRVVPVPGGPLVEITGIEDTVLLQPPREGDVGWAPARPGTGPQTIGLDVIPTRCDPHAVAEDKRGTFFGVHARVDGIDQHVFYLPAGDALRADLRAFVGEHCAWGGTNG